MNQINLEGAKAYIESLGYKVYYIGVYGSQNYGLTTEKSDVDYKCIVVPTLEELVYQKSPTSTIVDFESGQIDIKDIRTYIESAVKVNVNFIEILSTEYFLGDQEIRKFFVPLLEELGGQYLRACLGMMNMKWKALSHPYPSKEFEISTYGYDPKQLMHIVRLRKLIERYLVGNYSFYHDEDERKELLRYKSGLYTLLEAEVIASAEINNAKDLVDVYSKEEVYASKYEMIKFSREVIKDIIINDVIKGKH